MFKLNEDQILTSYQTIPPKLKEALESDFYLERIKKIGDDFDLTIDDVNILSAAVGYVLLGFLPPDKLFKEINDYFDAEEKTVVEVVREVNRRILFPLHEELEKLYKLDLHIEKTIKVEEIKKREVLPAEEVPPEEKEKSEKKPEESGGKIISLEAFKIKEKPPERIEVKIEKKTPPAPAPEIKSSGATQEDKPFILHEEKNVETERPKTPPRTFSFPFRIFPTKPTTESPKPIKARVEEPIEKVVHYSELRTPLETNQKHPSQIQNLQNKEEIINLETFKPAKPPSEKRGESEINTSEENRPKLEGNVIDLKNG